MRITIVTVGDLEDMEMAVLPSHGRLDRPMHIAQGQGGRDEEPAPDRRADTAQCHFQPDNGFGGLGHGLCVLPQQAPPATPPLTVFCVPSAQRASGLKTRRQSPSLEGLPLPTFYLGL